MSDKKRKAASQEGGRPSKKQQTAGSVKVNHLIGSDSAKPVVATTAGMILPSKLRFKSYSKTNASGPNDLLLQSSDHPTIDYTAVESRTVSSTEQHMKHYVAVFDPATGSLDVTEAKKMIIRPQVRQFHTDPEVQEDAGPSIKPSARAALTEAFGTKKSKKVVQAMAENRLLARGDADDPLSQAILSSVAGDEDGIDANELIRSNKPLPRANIKAQNVQDAYPLTTLVIPSPSAETLSSLNLGYWKSAVAADKSVSLAFRFTSNRLGYLIRAHLRSPDDESILQLCRLLRYIDLLLQLHRYVMALRPTALIQETNRWPSKILNAFRTASKQSDLLPNLVAHFFPDQTRSKYALTLLRATIFALSLHMPPGSSLQVEKGILASEPAELSLDLAMEQNDAFKLFRELGCKLAPATDKELVVWGISKKSKKKDDDGKEIKLRGPKFAKLSLPLEFPKLSQGASPAKRR